MDAPASWNLYAYVRNNPLKYVDPTGQEVCSTKLTDDQKKQLINDWKEKSGYQNVYFDQDNMLVVDTKAGFKGGSASARQQLTDAIGSADRFNLEAVSTTAVAFGHVDRGTNFTNAVTKQTRTEYTVQIDFNDFKNVIGSDSAKKAFSVGLIALHEFNHKLYNMSDSPNGANDPGPLERTYINPIRRELGLPERVSYSSQSVKLFQDGGQQLDFGKDKFIRWRNDLVGGKIKD